MKRHVILAFSDYYLPGNKGGGPIQSLANMVLSLGGEFEFRIVTSDRDLSDPDPYPDIIPNRWTNVGKAKVLYLPSWGWTRLPAIMADLKPDLIYFNSFFSRRFSIMPLICCRLWKSLKARVLIAPRGEFSKGALAIKPMRKRAYLAFFRLFRLGEGATWHASTEWELKDIQEAIGGAEKFRIAPPFSCKIRVAPDIVCAPLCPRSEVPVSARTKRSGFLEVIFISRISQKKNLHFALELLAKIRGTVCFSIYGPREDLPYWNRCEELICKLPSNISAAYCGALSHKDVEAHFRRAHLFFFPTQGENYGHVIVEAFLAGCPVLLSDTTPWRNLEELGVGADCALAERQAFVRVLNRFVDMDEKEFQTVSARCAQYGHRITGDQTVEARNRSMLRDTIESQF